MYAFILFCMFNKFQLLPAEIVWDKGTKLMSNSEGNNDAFGRSVAINDKYIVVGNPYDTVDGTSNVGSVHIFSINGTEVKWETELVPGEPTGNDFCARAVSLNSKFIVFGCANSNYRKGRVFVYRYDRNSWNEREELTADDASNYDLFGSSVGLNSNNELVVGASGDDKDKGAAYIFSYDNKWRQERKLVPSDRSGLPYSDEFGKYIAISNRYIAVYSNNRNNTGAVYVYKKTDTWAYHQKIVSPHIKDRGTLSDVFSINEKRLVVGASEYVATNRDYPYKPFWKYQVVYVYVEDGEGWRLEKKLDAINAYNGSQFAFGGSISIHNNLILVGASEFGPHQCCYGTAYLYCLRHGKWKDLGRFTPNDIAYGDRFGSSVSISGKHVVIGSSRGGEDGVVYFFLLDEKEIPKDSQITGKLPTTVTEAAAATTAITTTTTTTNAETTVTELARTRVSTIFISTQRKTTTNTRATTIARKRKRDTNRTLEAVTATTPELSSGQSKIQAKNAALMLIGLITPYFILFLVFVTEQ